MNNTIAPSATTPYILFLPEIALEKIFSFLTYDEIAKNRIVCKQFNEIGSKLLSRGFLQLEKRHAVIHKRIKSLLPRRESERRAHPLFRHSDILQAIETRISMLNMTYIKYIEGNLLCFIPGKVLDEMRTVLCLLESSAIPPRTHVLLQELRDLSSMAMEHFDEHILPRVKEQMNLRSALSCSAGPSNSKYPRIFISQQIISNELHKVKKQCKTHKHHITYLTQNTLKLFQKLKKQNVRLKAQSVKIREQERKIQEQETTLADIKKHIDEWDQKYADLTTELVRARDDILSKTAAVARNSSESPSPPKLFKSNIKPRMANIFPKRYMALQFDLERKRKSSFLPDIPLKRNRSPDRQLLEHIKDEKPFVSTVPDLIDMQNKKSDGDLTSGKYYGKNDFSSIISNSIENLKNSLTNIKSRKRKLSDEIDLK